ncbi:hypothetical protein [Geodermatophilus sp. SYSU D00815]
MRRPLRALLLPAAALLGLTACAVEVRGTATAAAAGEPSAAPEGDPTGAPADLLAVVPVEDRPSALTPDLGSGASAVITPDDDPEGGPSLVRIGPVEDGGGPASIQVVEDRPAPSVGLPHAAHTAEDGTVVLVGIPHPGDPLRLRVVSVDDGVASEPATVDPGPEARFVHTALSPDGRTLYLLVDDGGTAELLAADPATGQVTARAPVDLLTTEPVEAAGLVATPAGGLVAVFDAGGAPVVAEFDAALTRRGEPVGLTTDGALGSALSITLLPDGRALVAVDVGTEDAQRIRLVAVAADVLTDVAELGGGSGTASWTGALVVDTDGLAHLPGQVDGRLVVTVVDVEAGEAVGDVPLCDDGEVTTVAASRHGSVVYLGGGCAASGDVVWAVG